MMPSQVRFLLFFGFVYDEGVPSCFFQGSFESEQEARREAERLFEETESDCWAEIMDLQNSRLYYRSWFRDDLTASDTWQESELKPYYPSVDRQST